MSSTHSLGCPRTPTHPSGRAQGATIAQIKLGIDRGVLYLDGGWQSLVDGLERAATHAGVRIMRGAQVTAIARDGRGVSGSLASGERVSARAVILCTGPTTARTLLGDLSIGGLLALHAACLDVGLSKLPRPERLFALGIDRPTYFSVHSASARLAEAGMTIHTMKYLDPGEPHDAAADERELEEMLDLVQPRWRDHVTARRFLPSLVSTNALVEPAARRPGVDAAGMEGAFLAGDWVGSEGMLADAAMASARAAAERAIAHVASVRTRGAARANMMASS
jgi:phytoene dehydrogenase-like protein